VYLVNNVPKLRTRYVHEKHTLTLINLYERRKKMRLKNPMNDSTLKKSSMRNMLIVVASLILGINSYVFASNYGVIRTEDMKRQNLNEWQEDAGVFEMTEKSEGSEVIEGLTVELVRNVQTGKLIGKDMYGNIYGTLGNTTECGKVINPSKEINKNVKMTVKWEGRIVIEGLTVELMRNVQTGKIVGKDMYGNIYGVVGNTNSSGKIINHSKEITNNIEMISNTIKSITRGGKQVILTRDKKSGKLNGNDAWGNCYAVPGNTSSSGKIIDISKETIANISILK